MTRARIVPQYWMPDVCHRRCFFCHPLAGMAAPELTPEQRAERLLSRLRSVRREETPTAVELALFGGPLEYGVGSGGVLDKALRAARQEGLYDQLRVAVRPDLLSEARLERLLELGLTVVELEVASLVPEVLARMGDAHARVHLEDAYTRVRAAGRSLGISLRLGTPGARPAEELRQSAYLRSLRPDFVRLHPTLVLQDTWLERELLTGRYVPWTLEEAVTQCRLWLERLEEGALPVVRLGLQPVRDLGLKPGCVVGGPFHPSLRSLVETERMYERAARLLERQSILGAHVLLKVARESESHLRGPENHNIQRLRRRYRCASLQVQVDPTLARAELALESM